MSLSRRRKTSRSTYTSGGLMENSGGKFTLRLLHPITPVLYESLLFALIGDQFDSSDGVVGCVLSVRQSEDILSVWVEEEGDSVRNGALR